MRRKVASQHNAGATHQISVRAVARTDSRPILRLHLQALFLGINLSDLHKMDCARSAALTRLGLGVRRKSYPKERANYGDTLLHAGPPDRIFLSDLTANPISAL